MGTTPEFLTLYISAGFVIDENDSNSQNVGMFNATNIVARKVNQLPKTFMSPEFSDFSLGYVESNNAAYVSQLSKKLKMLL